MRVVVALGGNALLRREERPDAAVQLANVRAAVAALAPLAHEHELVITHGNGPQVGVLALESAADRSLSSPYPFDVLGAETQGMIGYWLLQSLQNALPGRQVCALLNQTLVSAADPAFADPAKFVGPVYERDEAERLAADRGWTVKQDGTHWRRVVPSPRPQRVVETRLIRLLLQSGAVAVCAGGGGVPVIRDGQGQLTGVEAVVDKDLTAASWPRRSTPTPCCCSPTSPTSLSTTAPPTPSPSDEPPPQRCEPSTFRRDRWAPRSTPCAGSWNSRAARQPSAPSETPAPSSTGPPAPSSHPPAATSTAASTHMRT